MIARRRTMRRLSLDKCLVQGRWPDAARRNQAGARTGGNEQKNPEGQKYLARLTRRHGKGKALSILAHKLGRATYFVMTRSRNFDEKKFLAA